MPLIVCKECFTELEAARDYWRVWRRGEKGTKQAGDWEALPDDFELGMGWTMRLKINPGGTTHHDVRRCDM